MAVVRYLVDDVDEAIEFYSMLGFELGERWGPPFASLDREDLELWVSGPGTSAAEPMPDGREPAPGGWNRLVVRVGDIEETVAELTAAGYGFRNDILEGPGGSQVIAEDPSGNPVELFEPRDR